MTASLQQFLESTFNRVEVAVLRDGRMSVSAPAESIPIVLRHLKEHGLNHLALVSCVDWIEDGTLELVYLLTCYMPNTTHDTPGQTLHVLLKTRVPRETAALASVIDVFENAEPYEREIHELFGVDFHGHPRLVPLFLERHYDIPPFRKEFDTRKYVQETFDRIPSVET